MKQFSVFILCLILGFGSIAQNKIPVNSVDDLPKHTYELKKTNALELIQSEEDWTSLLNEVKQNLEADLTKYDIQDKKTLTKYYDILAEIEYQNGNYNKALEYIELSKKHHKKEVDKYMTGILTIPLNKTFLLQPKNDNALKTQLTNEVISYLENLPFDIVKDEVARLIAQFEMGSDGLVTGMVQSQIQPIMDKTEGIAPHSLITWLINLAGLKKSFLPHKDIFLGELKNYYAKHHVEKEMKDIWTERDVTITPSEDATKVVLAVWDSGVNTDIFEKSNQLWTNTKEVADGKDSDGNGFVDDIHGIAYNLDDKQTTDLLFPIKTDGWDLDEIQKLSRGIDDLNNVIQSDDATYFKKSISELKPDEINPFIEKLNLFGNYRHGTHVAGIMVKDNASAQLLTARLTFGWKIFAPLITKESIRASAKMFTNTVEYFKANNVKVVNMSWSYSEKSIVYNLEEHGVGKSDKERRKIAKRYFNIQKTALYNAIQNAPDILFVCAAGNSNDDVDFVKKIPSSLDLPNLMVIGAVDQAGVETGFTTIGKSVDVFANGYKVESYVPSGETEKFSGTSMASPQVANLAGKILAKYPNLTPLEVKDLIIKGATISDDNEKVLLIHPQQSMKLIER